mmetsp:Transcript_4666/g.7674  ORF Transcript_4666/g.7674 Transcript_4666/m.7674 type:complete len:203 (-) Transcript_4666:670-1278(-)
MLNIKLFLCLLACLVASSTCFVQPIKPIRHNRIENLSMGYSSRTMLQKCVPAAIAASIFTIAGFPDVSRADLAPAPWDNNVKYEVLKSNPNGLIPKVGENVAIRFKGSYKGNVFDDTISAPDAYFYRAGVGLLLKGVDDAVVNMHLGDTYHLVFGGDLGFGEKGRPSAPGKPRIPPNAELDFEVQLVSIPGTEDEFIADVED